MRHLFILISLLLSGASHAGIYSDDMGRCLVASTSQKDKAALVRWVFATAALHPEVGPIATISAADRDRMDRGIATLFERLVTQDCRKQTMNAIRYEGGQAAFQRSFGVLGEAAMYELMTDQTVGAGFQSFTKYLDKSKLDGLGVQQ